MSPEGLDKLLAAGRSPDTVEQMENAPFQASVQFKNPEGKLLQIQIGAETPKDLAVGLSEDLGPGGILEGMAIVGIGFRSVKENKEDGPLVVRIRAKDKAGEGLTAEVPADSFADFVQGFKRELSSGGILEPMLVDGGIHMTGIEFTFPDSEKS